MKRKVNIDEEIRKYVRKVILEHVEEVSSLNDNIVIYTYDLNNDEDNDYIINRFDEIWDIIKMSYDNIGGIKGLNKPKDLIKKNNIVRLAFFDGHLSAVAFYSSRLGGNKMSYCGTKGTNGKTCMQAIINRDTSINTIEEFNWVECSGGIEILFRRSGGFNLPNKYASQVLGNDNITLLDDGYHYERTIGIKTSEKHVKTIYGFNSEKTIKKVYNDVFGELIENIKNAYEKLCNINENLKNENRDDIETSLMIFEWVDELHTYSDINEFPEQIIDILEKCIIILKENDCDKHTINFAEDLLNNISIFKIIHKNIKTNSFFSKTENYN